MIGLFGLQTAMAKVAYIPLFDFQNNLTFDDSIIVVDLTDGGVLKKNYIGAGVGPIFINRSNQWK